VVLLIEFAHGVDTDANPHARIEGFEQLAVLAAVADPRQFGEADRR
jgi:hypothetical protein